MGRSSAAEKLEEEVDYAERREGERVAAEINVTLESEHNFFKGFTENISEGGLFLATYSRPRIGETMTIRFTLPGVEKPIETEAEVRWSREMNPASDTPPGVGLKFVSLTDDDRKLVEQFVGHRDPLFFDD